MRSLETEVSSIHEDEPGSTAEASGTQVPQAQLTAADAAPASATAEVRQPQQAG
jgi:hypothetical protein